MAENQANLSTSSSTSTPPMCQQPTGLGGCPASYEPNKEPNVVVVSERRRVGTGQQNTGCCDCCGECCGECCGSIAAAAFIEYCSEHLSDAYSYLTCF